MTKLLKWLSSELALSLDESKELVVFLGVFLIALITFFTITSSIEYNYDEIVLEAYQSQIDSIETIEKNRPIQKNTSRQWKLESFDPNEVSYEKLVEMGVPKYPSKMLTNFRSKGKIYWDKEDVASVYGMSDSILQAIEPYLVFKTNKVSSEEVIPVYKEFETEAKSTKPRYIRPKAFDINTGKVEDFTSIYGIGEVFANRIIKYRDLLGGFHSTDQLYGVYQIKPEAVDSLLAVAFLSQNHKKFKINSIEIGAFKHPLLKYYQIKGIVNYRKQHGNFTSMNDLKKLVVLDDETLEKIEPYVSFAK